MTEFYQANDGKYSVPVMRARSFLYLCEHKTIYLGDDELIVGERGPRPKAVPTYPGADLPQPGGPADPQLAAQDQLRGVRRVPAGLRGEGHPLLARPQHARQDLPGHVRRSGSTAYDAGMFTEFMEQRAPGHTVLDDKIYRKGMLRFQAATSPRPSRRLDFLSDPEAYAKREQLKAMDISCDAVILFAERHAELAAELAAGEAGSAAAGRTGEDRRRLPPRAGPRPARFPRGPAVLLVLPPGGDHRAERLGLVQPRAISTSTCCRSTARAWPTAR